VMVACTEHPAALLQDALGGDSRIRFLSGSGGFRRTPEAILAYRELLEQEVVAGAGRIRIVGEVVFGERLADWLEWMRFEAVANRAFAPYPLWGVCLYDMRRLPGEVTAAAKLTHPNLRTPTSRAANPRYLDPAEFLRRFADAGSDPLEATAPALEADDLTDLGELRHQLRAALAGSALPAETKSEFVFAASEVATNALRHGRPPVLVRAWATSTRLLCAITDHGTGIEDPLAGYLPAHRDPSRGGLGLWLARRLCDHVHLRRTSEGFTVRLATGS